MSTDDMYVGRKDDGAAGGKRKRPWQLAPWDAFAAVVDVLQSGAYDAKPDGRPPYGERNWEQGLAHSRTFAAAQRHLTDWFQNGQDTDPESGLPTLAHAACEILFALAFQLRGRADLDDRP